MKPSINFRSVTTRNVILPAIAMMLLGFSTSMLKADVVTFHVAFSADSFQVNAGPDPAPVDPVIGSFTVTLDPDVKVTDNTANISLNSLNIDLGSQLSFSYDPAIDDPFPAGTLRVGGLFQGSDVIQFGNPSTNDFWLYIDDFVDNPTDLFLGYTQTSVSNSNLFTTMSGSVSVSSIPEPSSLLFGAVLCAAAVVARRRKRISAAG